MLLQKQKGIQNFCQGVITLVGKTKVKKGWSKVLFWWNIGYGYFMVKLLKGQKQYVNKKLSNNPCVAALPLLVASRFSSV